MRIILNKDITFTVKDQVITFKKGQEAYIDSDGIASIDSTHFDVSSEEYKVVGYYN